MPFPLLQDRLDLGVVVRSYNEPVRHLLWELFSPPRISNVLQERGYSPSRSFDVKLGWDLSQQNSQRSCLDDQISCQPIFVMASPPCTKLSSLAISNWNRIPYGKAVSDLHQALDLVDVTEWVCMMQKQLDHIFCIEHPQTSELWNRPSVT